jgi:hypothetical protein
MHIFLKLKSDWFGQTERQTLTIFSAPILIDITLSFRKGNFNMNSTSETSNQECNENCKESDLKIIAGSVNNIRRISLVMYIGDKMLSVYIIWIQQNLVLIYSLNHLITKQRYSKTLSPKQKKWLLSIDYFSLHLLYSDSPLYNYYAQPTLPHILNNLIPRIQINKSEEEDKQENDSD